MTSLFEFGVLCPGCDEHLTPATCGGYRDFCDTCVEAIPPPPDDGCGYSIAGKYPEFYWGSIDVWGEA